MTMSSAKASGTQHVFEFLELPARPVPGVVAVFGDEPFLKRLTRRRLQQQVLGAEAEAIFTTLEGDSAEWRDVVDELATVSLFGGKSKRLVVVADADSFVTRHRPALEDYVARPKRTGVLVLEVGTWASNTRLYKAIDQSGWQVDCRLPQQTVRGRPQVDEGRLSKWLVAWAKSQHGLTLELAAARLLCELVGSELGIIDQDLAKLALFAGPNGKVTAQLVQEIVGGWRAKTVWEMVAAAASGDVAEALRQLDHALQSGEHPNALFGQISWSLRRYTAATRHYQRAERRGERTTLREAVSQAGFRGRPEEMNEAEQQLLQLGRERAGRLLNWLLELDLSLKGSHSSPDRARWALELLFLKLARRSAVKNETRP